MDETCFVIQPFDYGKYDERYRDVFAHAIEAAGLKPYRVDQDASVTVPIDTIETEIRNATICLAEITEDNPNVWYELGFAFSANKPVVMVCSDEREKFPFDVHHRRIIRYRPHSPSQFEKLKKDITSALKNIDRGALAIQQIRESNVLVEKGLSSHERIVLATMASNFSNDSPGITDNSLKSECLRAGLTALAVVLALRQLKQESFIETSTEEGEDAFSPTFTVNVLTEKAWDWLSANQKEFRLERTKTEDPDIPF